MLVFDLLHFFFHIDHFLALELGESKLEFTQTFDKIALRFLFSKYDMANNIFSIT
jgi:hypothetical protein